MSLEEIAAVMAHFDKEDTGTISCKDFIAQVTYPSILVMLLAYVNSAPLDTPGQGPIGPIGGARLGPCLGMLTIARNTVSPQLI